MVGSHVLAFGGNSSNGHILIGADVVLVAGECVVTDPYSLAQINGLQSGTAVEGLLTDIGIFAQGDLGQLSMVGKGVFADDRIVADGQAAEHRIEHVVEILVAVFGVGFYPEVLILIHIEGILFQSDIVADHNSFQLVAQSKHTLRQGCAVCHGDRSDVGAGKGILTQFGIGCIVRQLGDAGFKECVVADALQLTQSDGGQALGRTEGIVAQDSNARQTDRGDLHIVGEGAACHSRNIGRAGIIAGQGGSHSHQGLAISRQNLVSGLCLVGLIAALHGEAVDTRFTERKLANLVHIGTDGHALHALCLVEHALRQNSCIYVEILQSLTAGKGIRTVFYLLGGDGHRIQLATAGKGILASASEVVTPFRFWLPAKA